MKYALMNKRCPQIHINIYVYSTKLISHISMLNDDPKIKIG